MNSDKALSGRAYHLTGSVCRYGLGTCYMRMSKLRLADYHFKKASQIHPQNAVLLGCVGVVSIPFLATPVFEAARTTHVLERQLCA